MRLAEKKECTGCMACYNICSVNAIDMKPNEQGFLYPVVNENLCIKCEACIKKCPIINEEKLDQESLFHQKIYAAWNKNDEVRKKSSSGGVFSLIAQFVLQNDGLVVGAGFDDKMQVTHMIVEEKEELPKLMGSKYVQSYIGQVYKTVREKLIEGKKVLFVGTPCQVVGIKKFIGQNLYQNLVTIDLACHGAPSPRIFNEYIQYFEEKFGSKVEKIEFRNKKFGWKKYAMVLSFCNGKQDIGVYNNSPYLHGFMKDIFLRDSCYQCKYTNTTREGDITLGDFWGYQSKEQKDIDDDRGISFVIINSETGKNIFDAIKHNLEYFERNIEDIKVGNKVLNRPTHIPKARQDFWDAHEKKDFDYLIKSYMKYTPTLKERLSLICPMWIKKLLKKVR